PLRHRCVVTRRTAAHLAGRRRVVRLRAFRCRRSAPLKGGRRSRTVSPKPSSTTAAASRWSGQHILASPALVPGRAATPAPGLYESVARNKPWHKHPPNTHTPPGKTHSGRIVTLSGSPNRSPASSPCPTGPKQTVSPPRSTPPERTPYSSTGPIPTKPMCTPATGGVSSPQKANGTKEPCSATPPYTNGRNTARNPPSNESGTGCTCGAGIDAHRAPTSALPPKGTGWHRFRWSCGLGSRTASPGLLLVAVV